MSLNLKCPKCGSTKVQLTQTKGGHGCLWLFLFGIFYVFWVMFKWMIGLMILCLVDWWMAIICAVRKKGYVWKSKKWFSARRRLYYCHECSNNFMA